MPEPIPDQPDELEEFPSHHEFRGPLHRRRPLRRDIRRAHEEASAQLRGIDSELEAVLVRRRGCLGELARYRNLLNRRYSERHGGRRPHEVDEPPVPPAPAGASPLWGVELRSVAVTILRRHGAQRLRDLHGLLHCYGYVVDSTRPVQRLADAMAYECSRGRAERLARGVYGATSPHPGPSRCRPTRTDLLRWPDLGEPLPWTKPATGPWPPLIDPPVASDPEHWTGGRWPGTEDLGPGIAPELTGLESDGGLADAQPDLGTPSELDGPSELDDPSEIESPPGSPDSGDPPRMPRPGASPPSPGTLGGDSSTNRPPAFGSGAPPDRGSDVESGHEPEEPPPDGS